MKNVPQKKVKVARQIVNNEDLTPLFFRNQSEVFIPKAGS